jgi:hypothetical protein
MVTESKKLAKKCEDYKRGLPAAFFLPSTQRTVMPKIIKFYEINITACINVHLPKLCLRSIAGMTVVP